MSGKVMGQVYDLQLTHGQQAVLLALADHAEHDGGRVFPSVDLISWKINYSERQVQRVMRQLERMNILIPIAYTSGGRGKPTIYEIRLENGTLKPPFQRKGRHDDTVSDKRVTSEAQKGDISDKRVTSEAQKGDIAMSPEPSYNRHIEPSENHARARASLNPDSTKQRQEWLASPEGAAYLRQHGLTSSARPPQIMAAWRQYCREVSHE